MKDLTLLKDYIDHLNKMKIEDLPSDDYLAGYTLGYFRGKIEVQNALKDIYAQLRGYDSWMDFMVYGMEHDDQS